ncbi:MAG: hypothetical protein M3O31_07545 [Acidobacteriota bacterium]|nr:hypothetical protein [Acidobacteriota bacterium]
MPIKVTSRSDLFDLDAIWLKQVTGRVIDRRASARNHQWRRVGEYAAGA